MPPPISIFIFTCSSICDALATAPARIDGEPLGYRIHPWLANDLFLMMRADGAAIDRPLRNLSNLASCLLVWVAAPLVLAGFWWRSMPAHEEWLTLLLALIACSLPPTQAFPAGGAPAALFTVPTDVPGRNHGVAGGATRPALLSRSSS
ncbi:hypothetical protein DU506_18075 [Vreelandella rituensis]|uniref:Uncharacterized protein n=1 Tax=Vreelandella rituensis TaxID=2282306 RepID=A0A368TPY6_9GAMM|nr:hypothetical protein DU506_18075 [Halomonas rituensis]